MGKVRLTKNELRKQKDDLKRYTRFLPMLELKARQLLVEIQKARREWAELKEMLSRAEEEVAEWVGVFAGGEDLSPYVAIKNIGISHENIAGVSVPVLDGVVFDDVWPDAFETSFWADAGVSACRAQIEQGARIQVARQRLDVLEAEHRTTRQRINLFEKVMIPQAQDHIRSIQIFLGDQQTAAVVSGKMAKALLERKAAQ